MELLHERRAERQLDLEQRAEAAAFIARGQGRETRPCPLKLTMPLRGEDGSDVDGFAGAFSLGY